MTTMTAEDLATKGKVDIRKMMEERLGKVTELTKEFEGDWSKATPENAEFLKDANDELGLLGERFDAIHELEGFKDTHTRIADYLKAPADQLPLIGKQTPEVKEPRDLGSLFVKSDAFKAFVETGQTGLEMEVKLGAFGRMGIGEWNPQGVKATLGTDDALAGVDSEYPPESLRLPGVTEVLFQQPNVADLMPQGSTSQNAIPFMTETVTSTGAVETAEAAAASEADISFAESTAPVRKIVVLLPVTDEAFADEPFLRSHVNARLPLFVNLREDSQLLNGDGIAPNLEGIFNVTGIQNQAQGADDLQDSTLKAMGLVRAVFLEPTGALMRDATWQTIRLSRTADGIYIFGSPADAGPMRLWGVPVTINQNMPANTTGLTSVLVGAFRDAAMVIRRQEVTLAVTDSHNDDFATGLVAIKATTRLAFPVFRPGGFVTVTAA